MTFQRSMKRENTLLLLLPCIIWKEKPFLIDTPGIKEFGLSQIEPEELSGYFVEMKDRIQMCRFNDCMHRDEPGCAVKDAFLEGIISESRYLNYLQMLESLEDINYWERN
jgi:ribosome biogenesis GTPase